MRVAALILALACGGLAQAPNAALAAFDAASIKPSPPDDPFQFHYDPVRFTAHDLTLTALIRVAYHLANYQLQAPRWMSDARFDVDAETQRPQDHEEMDALLKVFLILQFDLVTHHGSKDVNLYDLEAGTGGVKLKQVKSGDFVVMQYTAKGGAIKGTSTVSGLASALYRMVGRPVIDATGLRSTYQYKVLFTPGPENPFYSRMQARQATMGQAGGAAGRAAPAAPSAGAPSLFVALREQLGLKLVPRKGPITVLVVDHALRKPKGN